jgi:hypothetical protein
MAALHDSPENECPQRVRRAAKEARDGEDDDRAYEVALAAEEFAEPASERDDDDAGEDVSGGDPRDLVETRPEVPHHVREGDVDDGAVDDLHQRREHHGERDEVLVRRAL